MEKYSPKKPPWHHAEALAQLALLATIAGSPMQSFAASQGDWGTSSSATVKITLRILPPTHGQALNLSGDERDLKGHTVVQAYCAASLSSFAQTSKLFTASLPSNHSNARDPDLDHLLRASCPGDSAPIRSSQTRPGSDSDQLTVLVSPV